jgi:hypothetical protein
VASRILFLNTDYPTFMAAHYRRHLGLSLGGYDAQLKARNESLFGTADFMSGPMRNLGRVAIDIHANNRPLQEAWMGEHGDGGGSWLMRAAASWAPSRFGPRLVRLDTRSPRFADILKAQIAAFRPTVLYNHDPSEISADLLRAILPGDCALVGQIASPRNSATNWRAYDLLISSLPNFVAAFRREGLNAEHLPLAFEPRVWRSIPQIARDIPLSFVGSLSPAHRERLAFLEAVAGSIDLAVWGDGIDRRPPESLLRKDHRGSAWGLEMFQVLRRSQLTLNRHIDASENYANNMRLFEATGMGTCLVSDWKENLVDLFEPGKEVVAYRSTEECLDLIRYFSNHDAEREKIAAAGQARCHGEHNYEKRMRELLTLLDRAFD